MPVSAVSPSYSALEDCYDIKFYGLEIQVSDTSASICGKAEILFLTLQEIDTIVFELEPSLSVDSVYLPDIPLSEVFQMDGRVYIIPENKLGKNKLFRPEIFYEGGETNNGFFSGIISRQDFTYGKHVSYTLSEPFQSDSWFPVKQNLHDKADSVRLEIITDSCLLAGSNGLLKKKIQLENGKVRYRWVSNYPIAYYLISFAVSDYQDYSFYTRLSEKDSLLVQNFVYDVPELLLEEKERIDKTSEMLRLFSELFGRYPFFNEKYGHSMAPMGGGMEHQTMTTLQTFNFDLVSHELCHQWFGNNVTCSDWQNIWINEGFASYGEYLAREFILGKEQAIEWMADAHSYALSDKEGSIFLTEDEARDPNRIFSFPLSYKKGAAILHMIRNELNNDSLFFASFRKFQDEYADSVANAEDYSAILEELSGESFKWFFDQWYYGAGYPVLNLSWDQRGDSLSLETIQSSSAGNDDLFRFHTEILLRFDDGSDSTLRIRIDKKEQKFFLKMDKIISYLQTDPEHKVLMMANYLQKLPAEGLVELFPNPVIQFLQLRFGEINTEKTIRILDLDGKLVYQNKIGMEESSRLDLGYLISGVYFLLLDSGKKKEVFRIVKL